MTDKELDALKEAVRDKHALFAMHDPSSQHLRELCVCGYPTSPGTPACYALGKVLKSAVRLAECEQPPATANVWQDDDTCDVAEPPPRRRERAISVPVGKPTGRMR